MSTNHHTPLPSLIDDPAVVVGERLGDLDEAITATNATAATQASGIGAAQAEVTTARAGKANLNARLDADALAISNRTTTAQATADGARSVADSALVASRANATALDTETKARVRGVTDADIARTSAFNILDGKLATFMSLFAAISANTAAPTFLTRRAGAALIGSIGGDGTTVTVDTVDLEGNPAPHGFSDGD